MGPITLPYYGCQLLRHYGSEWQITYSDRREDNECNSPLLFIRIVKISNYAIYQQLSHQM